MPEFFDLQLFQSLGRPVMLAILAGSVLLGLHGFVNLARPEPWRQKEARLGLAAVNLCFIIGFMLICWLHLRIYLDLPLAMADQLADWLNRQLVTANRGAAYAMPLYDKINPPRYVIPLWIENEKYYFWFMCYGLMALAAWHRLDSHRFRAALVLVLAVQNIILFTAVDPFSETLPRFFAEITPWFSGDVAPMARIGLFMQLYPRMIFYYNAHYMWLHPPMLFVAYACITLTFLTSLFMLVRRRLEIEILGYDYAKLGYLMLTLGMLLGYPWALKAWGPNWWWDPKICSSIMMWAIYSTYLHTRLYANKPAMWYFSSLLGILCFAAMIFTFLASFFFPGEHTFQ
ncbi:MAG: cytochrome c biogenesis protein CcsA [Desulfurivibrionaceae bacterium]|nr:cytochrome c biogenesis protein CcsA [Desulfurivibrionaceae bacterium]